MLFLLVLGGFLGAIYFSYLAPEVKAATRFLPTTCNIIDKTLETRVGSKHSKTYRVNFLVTYSVKNYTYKIWTYDISRGYSSFLTENKAILNKFDIGRSYPCWYDHDNPETAVLKKGLKQFSLDDYFILGFTTLFLIIFCFLFLQLILILLSFFIRFKKIDNKIIELMSDKEKTAVTEQKPIITSPPKKLNIVTSLFPRIKESFLSSKPTNGSSSNPFRILYGIVFMIFFIFASYAAVGKEFIRIQIHFKPTQCLIKDKNLITKGANELQKQYAAELLLSYNAGGKHYEASSINAFHSFSNDKDSEEKLLSQHTLGESYPCWYDPNKPEVVLLTRTIFWIPILLFIGIPFCVLVALIIQLVKKFRNLSKPR